MTFKDPPPEKWTRFFGHGLRHILQQNMPDIYTTTTATVVVDK